MMSNLLSVRIARLETYSADLQTRLTQTWGQFIGSFGKRTMWKINGWLDVENRWSVENHGNQLAISGCGKSMICPGQWSIQWWKMIFKWLIVTSILVYWNFGKLRWIWETHQCHQCWRTLEKNRNVHKDWNPQITTGLPRSMIENDLQMAHFFTSILVYPGVFELISRWFPCSKVARWVFPSKQAGFIGKSSANYNFFGSIGTGTKAGKMSETFDLVHDCRVS